MIPSNYQVTYRDANGNATIVELFDCVWRKLVLNGKQLINRVWVRRRIHKTEVIELKLLHELPNHNWNYLRRTAFKAKLDSELKFLPRIKHKPKTKQQTVRIKNVI